MTRSSWVLVLGIVVMLVLLVVVYVIGFFHGLNAPPSTEPLSP